MNKPKGFTLVEMAMVVTVIALLVGGIVMGGGALLNQAKTASLLAIVKDLSAASRAFKVRYGYFPGDLPAASTQISGLAGTTCSGNGNGMIGTATEQACALDELVQTKAIAKVDFDSAAAIYSIQSPFVGNVSLASSADNRPVIQITTLPCSVALKIDRKTDPPSIDAKPLSQAAVRGFDVSVAAKDGCTLYPMELLTLQIRY